MRKPDDIIKEILTYDMDADVKSLVKELSNTLGTYASDTRMEIYNLSEDASVDIDGIKYVPLEKLYMLIMTL